MRLLAAEWRKNARRLHCEFPSIHRRAFREICAAPGCALL
jgi:hypothetical protein